MKRKRGFSLIEVLFVIGLLVILMGMSLGSGHKQSSQAQCQGLAQSFAEQLRSVRGRAIAQQKPMAVVIPSNAGASAHAQSIVILEGATPPRIVQARNFAGDFPQACVFSGTWPIDSSKLSNSSMTTTIDRAVSGASVFNTTGWLGAATNDYVIAFSPEGTAHSNNLPLFDGCYHLAVGSVPVYAATGTPPGTAVGATPNYFQLSQLGFPFTIEISPSGTIKMQGGLLAEQSGSVQHPTEGGAMPALAALPGIATGNTAPTITDVFLYPEPTFANLTTGTNATVSKSSFLTLVTYANDADGDRVATTWDATGPAGRGAFSAPLRQVQNDKVLDPVSGQWRSRSVWEWRPPTTAVGGEVYDLNCTIRDERGASYSASAGVGVAKIEYRTTGHLAYMAVPTGGVSTDVWVCNSDGSNKRNLSNTKNYTEWDIQMSPDGQKIIYTRANFTLTENVIMLMNSDGTDPRPLSPLGAWCATPAIDPAQSFVIYCLDPDNYAGPQPPELWRMNLDGSNKQQVLVGGVPVAGYRPSWNPSGTQIVMDGYPNNGDLFTVDYNPATGVFSNRVVRVAAAPGQVAFCGRYHPTTPNTLVYSLANGANMDSYILDLTAAPPGTIVPSQGTRTGPCCFSPDGKYLYVGGMNGASVDIRQLLLPAMTTSAIVVGPTPYLIGDPYLWCSP